MCTDLARAIQALGFKGDVGFQQILYPTVQDVRDILVFLIDKFPKDSSGILSGPVDSGSPLNKRIRSALQMAWNQVR